MFPKSINGDGWTDWYYKENRDMAIFRKRFYSDMIDSECSLLLNPKLFVWLNWHHNTPHAFFLCRQWKKRNPISICAKYLGDVRALMSKGIFPSPPSLQVLLHNTNTFVPLHAKNSRNKSQTSGGGNLGNCTWHSLLSFLFSAVSSDIKNDSLPMPLDHIRKGDSPLISIH